MKLSESTYHHGVLRLAVSSALVTMLLQSSDSVAGQWEFTPRFSIRETYTTNVMLRPEELARSDLVTQINPGISLVGKTKRAKVNISYTMNNLIYAQETQFTRIAHQLNASATGELLENFLFLDAKAAMFQQNASLFGGQAVDNVNRIGGNRADIRSYSISPYIRHRFGDIATTELRYAYSIVDSTLNGGNNNNVLGAGAVSAGSAGGQGFANSESNTIRLGINSGAAFRILGWGIDYNREEITFNTQQFTRPINQEKIIGNINYRVTPEFSLIGTGGYEKNSFVSVGRNPESPVWSGGFHWKPSERTDIKATAGKRFFGDTYFVAASHRTRITSWNVTYNEDVTTARSQFLIPVTHDIAGYYNTLLMSNPIFANDPILRQQRVNSILQTSGLPSSVTTPTNFLTNQFFLQRNLQASVAINGVKNTLLFRGFHMSRDAQTPQAVNSELFGGQNLTLLNNSAQMGGSVLWSWTISPRTNANLNLAYTRISFNNTNRVDNNKLISLSFLRTFYPGINGMLEYRHQDRDSNQRGNEYQEHAVTASLNMQF